MALGPEARVLLQRGSEYLGERVNIQSLSQAIRREPELLVVAMDELDDAIASLNGLRLIPDDSGGKASQRVLLPNAVTFVQNLFPHHKLPTLHDLTVGYGFALDDCKDAFKRVNTLMRKGEEGTDSSGWRFHMEDLDPATLVDALALEIYNERLRLFSRTYRLPERTILLAVEEMLAVRHPNSRMYGSVSRWYSEEEGFSPLLVGMVNGEVRIPFRHGQILRQTPNLRVVDGYKPGFYGHIGAERFVIEPLTDAGEKMLINAARQHNIRKNLTFRTIHMKVRQTLRTDRIAGNLRVLFGGFVEVPPPHEDTIPSPDRMEQCLATHPDTYTFGD